MAERTGSVRCRRLARRHAGGRQTGRSQNEQFPGSFRGKRRQDYHAEKYLERHPQRNSAKAAEQPAATACGMEPLTLL